MTKFGASLLTLMSGICVMTTVCHAYMMARDFQPIAFRDMAPQQQRLILRETAVDPKLVTFRILEFAVKWDAASPDVLTAIRINTSQECDSADRCTILIVNPAGALVFRTQSLNSLIMGDIGPGQTVIVAQGCPQRDPVITFLDVVTPHVTQPLACAPADVAAPKPPRFKFSVPLADIKND
jgi:hypothetical protein